MVSVWQLRYAELMKAESINGTLSSHWLIDTRYEYIDFIQGFIYHGTVSISDNRVDLEGRYFPILTIYNYEWASNSLRGWEERRSIFDSLFWWASLPKFKLLFKWLDLEPDCREINSSLSTSFALNHTSFWLHILSYE